MTSSRPVGGLRRLIPHAPIFSDEEKTREGRLAYLTAWVLFVVPLAYVGLRLFIPGESGEVPASGTALAAYVILPIAMAGISLVCMAILHHGAVRTASGLLVGATWVAFMLLSLGLGGVRDVSFAGLMLVVVLAGLLLGWPASAIIVVLSLGAGWALADAETSGLLTPDTDSPLEVLVGYAALFTMSAGVIAAANTGYRRLLTRVYQNERDMRAQNWKLRNMRESLERRVAERTEDLNRRSGYLEAAARVAYAAGEILDVEVLLRDSVNLIRDAFGLYYVGLFLVEPVTEEDPNALNGAAARPWAVLRAGSGEAGRRMLARGHRIRVGEGMIGWSIEQGQSRFAQHAQEDRVRLVAPELPETRAEAALPLRTRGRVVGALTVQSVKANYFDEDTVNVLQTMADLIAVALNNAELLGESELALRALRRAYGDISATAWDEVLRSHRDWGYRYAEGVVQPVRGIWQSAAPREGGEPAAFTPDSASSQAGTEVVIPMRLGDTLIGAVRYQRHTDEVAWEDDDVMLLNALTEQLVQALDSARLLQETQRQAAREQQVSEIAAMLANTVDVDTMLRTAVQELGRLPGVLEASVHLAAVQGTVSSEGHGGDKGNGDQS